MTNIDKVKTELELNSGLSTFLDIVIRLHPNLNKDELKGRYDLKNKYAVSIGAKNWHVAETTVRKRESAHTDVCCNKCGTKVNAQGFCIDETCIHWDWPQAMSPNIEFISEMSLAKLESKFGIKKRRYISAECLIDDDTHNVSFDASDYFASLNDQELLKSLLAFDSVDWCGDIILNEMINHFKQYDDHDILKFANYIQSDKCKNIIAECSIDGLDVHEWLKTYRPKVFKSFIKNTIDDDDNFCSGVDMGIKPPI